jgi:hypothetical protein
MVGQAKYAKFHGQKEVLVYIVRRMEQRWAATLNYATQPLSVSVAAPEFQIFCVALARS